MTMPLQEMLGGKYEILAKIGEGGIGSVYKVRHRLLEEIRVIKVLRPQAASKEDLQRRFLREAKMAIRLKHPGIAQLYDFSMTEEGTAYIVMEYIEGVGLDSVLKAIGPPSVDLTIEISRQALDALGYLHSHKFVHRDISPDNMMLTADHAGRPVVKLIDLGIAKNLEAVAQLTQTGVFLGKVRYSSPEQFSAKAGADELDHRSDIYSFGVMLYQLLTGVYPFEGESFTELAGCHLFQAPLPFEETDKEDRVSKGLREIVLKAVEKEPKDRFSTAAELSQKLDEHRDRDRALEDEVGKAIAATTAALPSIMAFQEPGSTQSRLDRDFGLVTTPEPTRVTQTSLQRPTAAQRKRLSKDVARIERLVAAGRHDRAQGALEKALARHGREEPLVALGNRLAEAPTTVRPAPGAGAPASSGTQTGLARKAVAIGAAAVVALAGVAALGWWLANRTESPQATSELSEVVEVDVGERWDPDLAEPDLTFRVVPAPPAPEDAATAVERVEQALPPGGPPPPPGGRPGPAAAGGPAPPPGPGAQGPPPEGRPPPGPGSRPGQGPPPPRERTQEIYKPGAVGVIPPVLLTLPAAEIPPGVSVREATTILVTALVDENGQVISTDVKRPMFKRKLKEAAVEAAKGARFRPAVRNGVAGRMHTFIRVTFPASP